MTRRERNLKPRHAKTAAPRAPLALWIPIALALLAIVVFAPAWRAPFEFDDIASIPGNPTIRTLWPASVPLNPPANTSVAGRPVVNVSLALNYAVNEWLGVDQRPDPYGPNKTVGYHAVNLLLHIGCALLLLGIIRRTLLHGAESHGWTANPNLLPVIAAALWVVHPIQTEAVDYIVQRTELVASACYLAALYLAIRAWEAGNRRATTGWRFAAVAVCLVGMGSKEIMVTAPFIVALYDRAFRVSSWKELLADRQRLVFYGALVATMTLAISLVAVNSRHGTVGFGLGVPWYRYFYSQAWAILHYLKLTAWPDQLTFDYGQRPIAGLAGVPGLLVLGAAFVATIVAWIRAERWAWAGFLGAWFFLTLAPSSSVVPITTEIAAERRVYLALAAVAVLVVIGADTLRRSIASRATREDARRWTLPATIVVGLVYVASSGWEAGRLAADHVALAWALRAGIGALAAGLVVVVLRSARPSLAVGGILLALGATTIDRCLAYENPEALWRDTVAKAPFNPRAYDNLAFNLFFDRPPRLSEAKDLYWRALALDSTYLHAWPGLASIAVDEGHPTDAVWLLERALAIDPNYADAVDHLGRLWITLGQPARAIPYLSRFASAYPSDSAFVDLGRAYMLVGRLDSAAMVLKSAIALNPDRTDADEFLGGMLAEQGRAAEAIALLERAAQGGRRSPVLFGLMSLAYAEGGRHADAVEAARAAASAGSTDANVYVLAGRAMLAAGEPSLAQSYLSRALQLSPSNRDAAAALRAIQGGPSDKRD